MLKYQNSTKVGGIVSLGTEQKKPDSILTRKKYNVNTLSMSGRTYVTISHFPTFNRPSCGFLFDVIFIKVQSMSLTSQSIINVCCE